MFLLVHIFLYAYSVSQIECLKGMYKQKSYCTIYIYMEIQIKIVLRVFFSPNLKAKLQSCKTLHQRKIFSP